MKAFWTYTLARLGIFVVTFAVVWLVAGIWLERTRISTLWVLLIALVVSSVVSIFALARLRQNLAANVHARAERMTQRIEESRSAEDVD